MDRVAGPVLGCAVGSELSSHVQLFMVWNLFRAAAPAVLAVALFRRNALRSITWCTRSCAAG
jgi:uncharacterized membrane protein